MMVVFIIGVLLAIAVPTLLSAQERAKARVATSHARQALSAGRVLYAGVNTFDSAATVPFDLSGLRSTEPSLSWTVEGGESTGPEMVSWDSISSTEVRYAVKSKAGDCFLIRDSVSPGSDGGTTYGKNVAPPTCRAGDATSYEASSVAADW